MTLISAIITDAYRESNLIAAGKIPSDTQITEALTRLSSMIAGVYGYDVGEGLQDWMVGTTNLENPMPGWSDQSWVYPIENSRILLNHSSAQTLYFPDLPENGARMSVIDINSALTTYNVTLNGNGRLIEGATTQVLSTAGLSKAWIYDADSANWRAISALVVTDEMPFPEKFDDYFIIRLAGRINPRYGRSLDTMSIARLQEVTEQLESTYRQTRDMPVPSALRRLRGPNDYGYDNMGARRGRFGWM